MKTMIDLEARRDRAKSTLAPPGLSCQINDIGASIPELLIRWRFPISLRFHADARIGWFLEVFHSTAGSVLSLQLMLLDDQNCAPATLHLCPWDEKDLKILKIIAEQDNIGFYCFRKDGIYQAEDNLVMTDKRRNRYRDVIAAAISHSEKINEIDRSFRRSIANKQQAHPAIAEKRIGELLKDFGILTDADIQAALAVQKAKGGTLGAILITEGFCEMPELLMTLQIQQYSRQPTGHIGLLLVQSGRLSESRLSSALAKQQKHYQPLGQILITEKFCTEQDIEEALAQQRKLRYGQLLREFLPLVPGFTPTTVHAQSSSEG